MSNNEGSDETGIIVAGRAEDGHCYILADYSLKASPDQWAREVVRAYHRWHADRVIAEVNNGGMLVETTLRMVDPNVSYKAVHACRGKVARAEPIAAMAEQRRIHHVGIFAALEDQLCAFTTDLNRARDGSPDRADALVWALSELAIQPEPGIIAWAREEAAKIEQADINPASYGRSYRDVEGSGRHLRRISAFGALRSGAGKSAGGDVAGGREAVASSWLDQSFERANGCVRLNDADGASLIFLSIGVHKPLRMLLEHPVLNCVVGVGHIQTIILVRVVPTKPI